MSDFSKRFEDLRIWQQSRVLTNEVRGLAKFP
jgi:hypothetical protein